MIDKKSERDIYIVERREFYSKPLSKIEVAKNLDYSNLPLKAAQNNNLGTVMILPDNTNILFRDVTVQDLADKASNEGLYEKDSSKPLKSEVLVSMAAGGGHFVATFSNSTHYFKTDFSPETNDSEEEEGFSYGVSHLISSFFSPKTDGCSLDFPELSEGKYFIIDSDHKCIFDQTGMSSAIEEDKYGNVIGKKYNTTWNDVDIAGVIEYNEDIRYPIEKEFSEMIGEVT
jgi:hypothetical protein